MVLQAFAAEPRHHPDAEIIAKVIAQAIVAVDAFRRAGRGRPDVAERAGATAELTRPPPIAAPVDDSAILAATCIRCLTDAALVIGRAGPRWSFQRTRRRRCDEGRVEHRRPPHPQRRSDRLTAGQPPQRRTGSEGEPPDQDGHEGQEGEGEEVLQPARHNRDLTGRSASRPSDPPTASHDDARISAPPGPIQPDRTTTSAPAFRKESRCCSTASRRRSPARSCARWPRSKINADPDRLRAMRECRLSRTEQPSVQRLRPRLFGPAPFR